MSRVRTPLATAAAALLVTLVHAPDARAQVPWGGAWRIDAEESRIEPYLGREALMLHNGAVWLDDAGFRDGVIEFDVAAPATQGFHGVVFRARDEENYEHFYLRGHLSGMPDATQYTPSFHGVAGWQIYAGPRYSLPVELVDDRWMHVRIAVRDRRAHVFVDGQRLVFPELVRKPAAGAVGLASAGPPAHFANVTVTRGAPELEDAPGADPRVTPPGTVERWRVSTAFPEERVNGIEPLDPADWSDLEWDALEAGPAGIANLARVRGRSDENNTVFAAVTLQAREDGPVRIRFGFSDRVRVFLNGRPLYGGNDRWRSRDYRFLGTIGLYDELVLPLERGENELWFAVSEDFGGWGVVLQLPESGGAEPVAALPPRNAPGS